MSGDKARLDLQELVQDYLNQNEITKRIKNIIGKSNRFSVNMDELRSANPRLAKFVIQDPIQAIKMFQDQLNQTIKNFDSDGGKGGGNNLKAAMA